MIFLSKSEFLDSLTYLYYGNVKIVVRLHRIDLKTDEEYINLI